MTKLLILQPHGWLAWLLLLLSSPALAFQFPGNESAVKPIAASGSMEVAFTPGQDGAALIISAIAKAHRQILVQAFSFTHDGIAQALVAAHHRGIEVKLIADREQTKAMERGQVPIIAAAGVPVWLDGEHQSAHNKTMVIDAGSPEATVVTGSYNFTKAAQFKNAENVLVIRGNRALAQEYQANWQRHLPHAQPYVADKHYKIN
jgi:phosphatidylserine/phosphatidylglycerophosphate/cardiolipin synthase-like enzyme